MKRTIFVLWTLLSVLLPGCREELQRHPIRGKVVQVHQLSIVIDHEPIEGFMDAMVMELRVTPEEAATVRAGDVIEATLVVGKKASRLEGVKVVGHEEEDPDVVVGPPPIPILEVGQKLERTELPGASGAMLVLGEGQGIRTVVSFLFTSCPIPEYCPLLATRLVALQNKVKGEARLVVLTLDPNTDSFEVLNGYGAQVGVDPEVWKWARLELDALNPVLQRFGMRRYEDKGTIMHGMKLYLLDEKGVVQHMEKTNQWDPAVIADKVLGMKAGG
jgi:protein SCO1/2